LVNAIAGFSSDTSAAPDSVVADASIPTSLAENVLSPVFVVAVASFGDEHPVANSKIKSPSPITFDSRFLIKFLLYQYLENKIRFFYCKGIP
jgi:hypothetical protein